MQRRSSAEDFRLGLLGHHRGPAAVSFDVFDTMLRIGDVLTRITVVPLAGLLTALVILLAQSPLWLDAVPFVFKAAVVAVAALAFFRPQDGLLLVGGA